ncbi:hypothetical protein BJY00DRAFT_314187 [Aspergillus carlsbadensis]|nr:hypothetical protein BJY00DRAFT_314187 [Aspergillus carlsbadensis]
MSPPFDDQTFTHAVEKFESKLTPEQAHDFRLTTIDDLNSAIAELRNEQMPDVELRNLERLESFVLRMSQFEQVATASFNTSTFIGFIHMGFVWGPLRFQLLTASSYDAAFDALLEMYEEIGLNIPQLEQYQNLFQSNAHMRAILPLIYADILRAHKKALKSFKHPVWKQLFRTQWDSSKVKFSRIIKSLQSHQMLLESQASLVELTEHQKSMAEGEERYRREKDDEDRRKRRAVHEWLSPANSENDQENYKHERAKYPGTGEWILRDNLVGAWSNPLITTIPLLWLTGIPGAGAFRDMGIRLASALGIAVFREHVAIAKRLLQCEYIDLYNLVEVNVGRETRALTARDLAKEKGLVQIVDAFTECEARKNGVTVEEWKAMHV